MRNLLDFSNVKMRFTMIGMQVGDPNYGMGHINTLEGKIRQFLNIPEGNDLIVHRNSELSEEISNDIEFLEQMADEGEDINDTFKKLKDIRETNPEALTSYFGLNE